MNIYYVGKRKDMLISKTKLALCGVDKPAPHFTHTDQSHSRLPETDWNDNFINEEPEWVQWTLYERTWEWIS